MEIKETIKNHFKNSDNSIGIYEKRPGGETVFMYNIHKMDETFINIYYLNSPVIGPSRIRCLQKSLI